MRINSAVQLTPQEHLSSYTRIRTDAWTMMQAYGMYTQYAESQGSSQASSSFPCSTAQGPPPIPPYNTGNGSSLYITSFIHSLHITSFIHSLHITSFIHSLYITSLYDLNKCQLIVFTLRHLSITYKGLAPGFGPRPSFAAPVPWMQPSPYFSPLGAAPYAPPMPPPGPPMYAQAGPSHSGAPFNTGTSCTI